MCRKSEVDGLDLFFNRRLDIGTGILDRVLQVLVGKHKLRNYDTKLPMVSNPESVHPCQTKTAGIKRLDGQHAVLGLKTGVHRLMKMGIVID